MAEHGGRYEEIEIDRQACLYNDLFGWARIAVVALMSRPAPDVLCGPSSEGMNKIVDANSRWSTVQFCEIPPGFGGRGPDVYPVTQILSDLV